MSVFHNNALIGAGGGAVAADFQIDRSIRLNDGDSAHLNRTPSSAGSRKTWSWSGWVKRSSSTSGNMQVLFAAGPDNDDFALAFDTDDRLHMYEWDGSYTWRKKTDQVFRDFSAWYHIVAVLDTSNSTAEDRARLYVNGARVTAWNVDLDPSLDFATTQINAAQEHRIGQTTASANRYLDAYLAEVNFLDGIAVSDATDFGGYDSNSVWQPKQYSGTYGTNGFRLTFADNSSNSALGTDSSGNNNTWTVNNITAPGGDHVYSAALSVPEGGGFHASYPAANAFDGNTSTVALPANTSTSVRWTYSSDFGLSGAVEIYVGGASMSVTFDDGRTAVTAAADQYTQISSSVDFTWFNVYQGSGVRGNLAAVRVGGTVLIDSSGANNDSLIDTPTNYTADSGNNGGNYARINSFQTKNYNQGSVVISNGNLEIDTSGIGWSSATGTIAVSSGKWYWEYTCSNLSGSELIRNGIFKEGGVLSGTGGDDVTSPDVYIYASNANKWTGSAFTSYGASYTAGDVIGVALDLDAGTLTFYKNGSSQGSAYTGLSGTFSAYFAQSSDPKSLVNFGQRPFAYTPPTGYVSLCTQNLADPTVADGSTAFDASLWTGNGGSLKVGGTKYSSFLTASGTGFRSGNPATKAFDGTDANAVTNDNNGTLTFNATGLGLSGAARVRFGTGNAGTYTATFTGSSGTQTDSQSLGASQAAAWTSSYDVGTLTSISVTTTSGSQMNLMQIEVGGTVLIDGNDDPFSFSPDLVWIKARSATYNHYLVDQVRGFNGSNARVLQPNLTNAEESADGPGDAFASFNDDGFTVKLGTGNWAGTNQNNVTYVGWAWDAGANSSKTYTVTVVSDSGNKYRFDGHGTSAVTLDLEEGSTYVFDQSDSSNSGHPLRFSTTSDGTHGSGTEYTTGVTATGTPGSAGAKTTIVVAASAPTLYYYCSAHSGMGGQANTNSTAGASNFDGSIQSTVRANQSTGFSIVTYTGTGSTATIGHGLNAAPGLILIKSRTNVDGWPVYHQSLSNTANNYLTLHTTNAVGSITNYWNGTNSSVIGTLGGYAHSTSGEDYVAYCFAPVEGYSAFGSYTGNGSSDGPYVTLSFRPAFLMFKRTDSTGTWEMYDTARDTYNPYGLVLTANTGGAEADVRSGYPADILSNGFKLRHTGAAVNASGGTYAYIAFAEHPFKTARAR